MRQRKARQLRLPDCKTREKNGTPSCPSCTLYWKLLRDSAADTENREKRSNRAAGAAGSAVRTALPAALILLFIGTLMLYTYMHVIRKTAVSCSGDFLTGGSRAEDVVRLEPGVTLRQTVTAGQDKFSGIGIRLTDEKGKAVSSLKTAACADAVLEWGLFDETGTAMLTGGSAPIKDLKKVRSLLTKDAADEKLLAAAEESFVLAAVSLICRAYRREK